MTNTPCQSKSGTAAIGAKSGLALSCRRRNKGVLLIIVVRRDGDTLANRGESWVEDEAFMAAHYTALSGAPTRVVLLHGRKHILRLGIDDGGGLANETSYWRLFVSFSGIGQTDPITTGRHPWWNARFVGVSLSAADQRIVAEWNQSGETRREGAMVPVDETREPADLWNNTDPADHDRLNPDDTPRERTVGKRGFALVQEEYEDEVKAFHEEHGHYPKLMMVFTDRHMVNRYDIGYQRTLQRMSISALGLHDLPDQYDQGDRFFDPDPPHTEFVTHLSRRSAMGDAMRSVRDKYGVQTEVSDYGIYPDFNAVTPGRTVPGLSSRRDRIFREVGEQLKRALTIDGPLPGAPEHFAVPWPEP